MAMTVQELYDFAKKHGFEKATIWVPTGTNVQSSIDSAVIEIRSDNDDSQKQIRLIYNS